jgi:hypothetical protein
LLACAKATIDATLSNAVIERRMSLESADLAGLSFEALDDLLLRSSVKFGSEDELLFLVLNFGLGSRLLLRHIQPRFLSAEGVLLLADHFDIPPESIWECAAEVITQPLDSRIISRFPAIFAEFRGKRFKLLWRGSRDGFFASQFHRRCDGHSNTLTVILDRRGNIFGGFTPVAWDSISNRHSKADHSRKSFLFTLKNPHNIEARRFALRADKGHSAIVCDVARGPCFGDNDLMVPNDCNANGQSSTWVGWGYANDTGLNGNHVLTGWTTFKVEEIEEIEGISKHGDHHFSRPDTEEKGYDPDSSKDVLCLEPITGSDRLFAASPISGREKWSTLEKVFNVTDPVNHVLPLDVPSPWRS